MRAAGGGTMLNRPRKIARILWLRFRIWWLCWLSGTTPAEARRQHRIRQLTSGDPAEC